MDTRWILLITLTVAAVAVLGCTTSTPAASPTAQVTSPTASAPTPTAQASLTASVIIKDFSFKPDAVTIARGGTVTWTNNDTTIHTVKFTDSQSSSLQNGDTYSKKFDAAGSFDYSCGIHPSMQGTVKVI
jgi:plastocyanin